MPPPNILFIVLDDLNAWIGALGRHPQAQTPHIDALARRGVLFENAYCSAPYCNASRMGLFTGQLPSTLGIYDNEPFWGNPARPPVFIERLREAGYRSFGAGKVFHGVFDYASAGASDAREAAWIEIENRVAIWDAYADSTAEPLPLNRPMNRLFDFSAFDQVPPMYRHFDWGPLPAESEGATPDAAVARAVSAYLAQNAAPFFCAAGIYKPHLPWHAPQRFFDLYDRDTIILPQVRDDDLDDVPPIGRQWALNPPDHELVTSRGVWRDAVRGYLACVSYADHIVGQIVAALDASPARDNTAIILCGDNGFHLGEKLHWRKFALWEEATRVPLIVVPPGGASGVRVREPVSLIDICPTVLDLAGLATLDGEASSLVPFISNADAKRGRPVITTWLKGNHSLRDARYRYTRYSDGGEELYDHAADPYEWTNLANQQRDLCGRFSAAIDAQCGAG